MVKGNHWQSQQSHLKLTFLTEHVSGRTGNDIASALIALLNRVVEKHPSLANITLWSDSCVAQNKNRVMTLALMKFLSVNPNIQSICQKFGTPGHSFIQEVDNIHSQIERRMKKAEIFSPIGFVRLLMQVNPKTPLAVVQLNNFTDYHSVAKHLKFDIPFTQVQEIRYSQQNILAVGYRTNFKHQQVTHFQVTSRCLPPCRTIACIPVLSTEKLADLKKMLKYMPKQDEDYYTALLESHSNTRTASAAEFVSSTVVSDTAQDSGFGDNDATERPSTSNGRKRSQNKSNKSVQRGNKTKRQCMSETSSNWASSCIGGIFKVENK